MGSRLDLDSPSFKQELLRTILHNTPMAYVLIDGSYKVRFVNDHLTRLRRLKRGEIIGETCYNAVNGGAPCQGCVAKRAMEEGGDHKTLRRDTLPDGSVVFTEDRAVPLNLGGEDFTLQMLVDRTLEMQLKEKDNAMFLEVVQGMFKILEKKDPATCVHSREVSAICSKLTWQMEMGDEAVFQAALGGLLHDLGKLHIPDAVLNKCSALDKWEFDAIMEHPIFTYLLMPDLEAFKTIREIAISHHERWDGTGYPNGLKGEEIPLEARIAAVADSYSAMTSDRPYRKGVDHETAMSEIRNNVGTQFDPQVAETFIQMVDDYCLDKSSLTAPDESLDFIHLNLPRFVQRHISSTVDASCKRKPADDAEDEFVTSETLIKAIFDNTPAHYIIIDESFNILFVSDSFARARGKSKEEIYAGKCFDATENKMHCFQVEDGCIRCPCVRAFATGAKCQSHLEETIDGKVFHYSALAVPLELEGLDGEKVRCCLEILLDRTDEKLARTKFEADLIQIVEVLYNLIAELDLSSTENIEGISAEAVSFNDYLNRVQDDLTEMLGLSGTA